MNRASSLLSGNHIPGNRLRHLSFPNGARLYIPKAIREGTVHFGPFEARSFILPNHTRVLMHQSMLELLGMGTGGQGKQANYRLGNFASQNRFNGIISNELRQIIFSPILFRTTRGRFAYGYEAIVLADLCESILKVRDKHKLTKSQEHIATRAELLIRAFARVGIIALIDEATGHQSTRAQDALQRYVHDFLLTQYRRKWKQAFDLRWFEQLCRLKDWAFDPHTMRLPPQSGQLVNRLVYQRLAPGVCEALNLRNPKRPNGTRRDKHHQWLNEQEGLQQLVSLVQLQIRLMKASETWEEFLGYLDRFCPVPILEGAL